MVRSAIDPIRPGASLILAWQIKQRHAIIIGGGFVAAGRLVNVLEADAKVTVICPDTEQDPLSETVRQHLEDHPESTRLVLRSFHDSDLTTAFGQHKGTYSFASATIDQDQEQQQQQQQQLNSTTTSTENSNPGTQDSSALKEPPVDMVLSAIDDIPLSTHIYHLCKSLRIPVNIADVPPQCDFYFCSTHRDQSLQVAVSTSGKGPKLANLIRRHIANHLPNRVGDAIEQVGKLRAKLRKMAPGPEVGPKRMQWMSRVCEEWKMEELAELDDETTNWVLQGFKDNVVYSLDQVREMVKNEADREHVVDDANTQAAMSTVVTPPSSQDIAPTTTTSPRLVLVGAGPGDPELLTLKALRLLEAADLVVADRLIPLEVMDLAKGEVRIAPKKRSSVQAEIKATALDQDSASVSSTSSDCIQDQLNDWCLQGLREGKTVVRLKQGDPFIFGRGAEEILFFREHGFEAEVVPGISSALSAPLAAYVPLTHRGSADQVVITTAQAKGGVLPENFPTYDTKRTVVILMGVGKAKEISDLMQSSKLGWPSDIPVVIVENAHCPNERTMGATLGSLAQVVEEKKAVPPSVFVVVNSTPFMPPISILTNLPQEVLDSVLSLLTPMDLTRCVLVSKTWLYTFTPYLYRDIYIAFDMHLRRFHTVETHAALKRHACHVRTIKTRFYSILAPFLGLRLDNLTKIEFPWECQFQDPPLPVPLYRPPKSLIKKMRAELQARKEVDGAYSLPSASTSTISFGSAIVGRVFGGGSKPTEELGTATGFQGSAVIADEDSDDSDEGSTQPPPPLDPYAAHIPLELYLISVISSAPKLKILCLKGVQFSKPDLIKALVDSSESCLRVVKLEPGVSETAAASTIRYLLEKLPTTTTELSFKVDLNPLDEETVGTTPIGPLLAVKRLTIEGDMAGHAASLWIPFLRRCQVLGSLSIKSLDTSLAGTTLLSTTLSEHCPLLHELTLDRPLATIQDIDIARLISAPVNGWQTLRVTYCDEFGPLSSAALADTCHSLEVLAIEGTGGLKSRDLQRILCTNQRMRRLDAITEGPVIVPNNVVLSARDLVQGGPWTCSDTLETFKVLISDVPRPDVQKGPGMWPLTGPLHDGSISDSRELQWKVMAQLGRLVRLKQLWLGHDDQDFEGRGPESYGPSASGMICYLDTGFQYSCLDFSLAHGLGLLEGLQELEDVDIRRMSLALGEEEVAWMLQYWPKLSRLVGAPYAMSRKIRQLRPGIRQSM
ncbi:hypothetical protein BGZ83_007423 [Gryganskiella cystojenkinii]|nr:hypothetical protein BGZ83_007423 [Gryganskiella cystojenkinii]